MGPRGWNHRGQNEPVSQSIPTFRREAESPMPPMMLRRIRKAGTKAVRSIEMSTELKRSIGRPTRGRST